MKKLKELFNRVSMYERVQGAIFGATAGFVMGGGHPIPTVLMGIAGFITGGDFLSNVFNAAMFGKEFAFASAGAGIALGGSLFGRKRGPQLPV